MGASDNLIPLCLEKISMRVSSKNTVKENRSLTSTDHIIENTHFEVWKTRQNMVNIERHD